MTDGIVLSQGRLFDAIRHFSQEFGEYWKARELQEVLGYSQWRTFEGVIERAKLACENIGHDVASNFHHIEYTLNRHGATPADYWLSRYACYLVALNGDPYKNEVALAQNYFVAKTHQAEQYDDALAIPRQLLEPEIANFKGTYLDRIDREMQLALRLAGQPGDLAVGVWQEIRKTPKTNRLTPSTMTKREQEIEHIVRWIRNKCDVGKPISTSDVQKNLAMFNGERLGSVRIREAFAVLEKRGLGTITNTREKNAKTQRFTLSK